MGNTAAWGRKARRGGANGCAGGTIAWAGIVGYGRVPRGGRGGAACVEDCCCRGTRCTDMRMWPPVEIGES